MNIKTYTFTKYIATIGSVFLFIAPLLAFLQEWKDLFKGDLQAMKIVTLILLIVGLICMIIYVFVRYNLKNKSGYKYSKKDSWLLLGSISSYAVASICALIYVIIVVTNPLKEHSNMIAFAPLYVILVIAMIGGAILESMSRVDEQAYLYQEQENNKDDITTSSTNSKRTKQAQELLKKANKEETKEIIEDEKAFEKFFAKEEEKIKDEDKDNK